MEIRTAQGLSMSRPVLIMAGGTGGHVYPALAVANEFVARGVPVVWMGTQKGIEARLVPAAGFDIEWLSIAGLRGRGMFASILFPFHLLRACLQAMMILLRQRPCVVLGMGGFVSGPGGLMAWCLRKPLVIHEQNSIAGMTNRCLSRLSKITFEAFPGSLASARHIGNPVRSEITGIPGPRNRNMLRENEFRLLVFGGSLGASYFNEAIPQALRLVSSRERIFVHHQCGKSNLVQTTANYKDIAFQFEISEYIEDMAEAYSWADLVLCRAGAMTIAELTAVGIASVLVPYPFAVDDHQSTNARFLVDANAAIVLQQHELTPSVISEVISELANDRQRVMNMALAARSLARPEATQQLVDTCLDVGRCV